MIVHVTILSGTCEGESIWGKAHTVDGTEMTVDLGQLFIKDNIDHFHFESTLCSIGGCHIFGVLASSDDNVEFLMVRVFKNWGDYRGATGLAVIELTNYL